MDILILLQVQEEAEAGCDHLAQDCGKGRARHAHLRKAEKAEDHDGVEDDIDNGAGRLGDHAVKGPAGGLEQALKGDLEDRAEGQAEADPEVDRSVLLDDRVLDLGPDEGTRGKEADQEKEDVGQDFLKKGCC